MAKMTNPPGGPAPGPNKRPSLDEVQPLAHWAKLPSGVHINDIKDPIELRRQIAATGLLKGRENVGLTEAVKIYKSHLYEIRDKAGREAIEAWIASKA
jgi:hypothetical protein